MGEREGLLWLWSCESLSHPVTAQPLTTKQKACGVFCLLEYLHNNFMSATNNRTPMSLIYIQAMNPCLRCGVRFAHPPLQDEFRVCRGLRPRTPGCIPISVLAAPDPNHYHCFMMSIYIFTSIHFYTHQTN